MKTTILKTEIQIIYFQNFNLFYLLTTKTIN